MMKIKILRDDLKKNFETNQSNKVKQGDLGRESANELEIKKEEILKANIMLETEKDMIKRKIHSFKNTIEKEGSTTVNLNENQSPRNIKEYKEFQSKQNNANQVDTPIPIARGGNLNISKKYSMESDEELENNLINIDNNFLSEINSDVERNVIKTEFSDGTSMNSINSDTLSSPKSTHKGRLSFMKKPSNEFGSLGCLDSGDERAKTVGIPSLKNSKTSLNSDKELYREFVKVFLKIKFEKLDNDHLGQRTNQNHVWDELCKQKILKENWKPFILNELKNFRKYQAENKKSTKKLETMDTIHEEN